MVWLGFGIPITLALVISGNYQNFWLVWGQCALAIIGHSILVFNKVFTERLSLIVLNSLVLVMSLGWIYGANGFYAEDRFWSSLLGAPLTSKSVMDRSSQTWRINEKHDLVWSFEGKLSKGAMDWDWRRSDARFVLERLRDNRGVYTRVLAPSRKNKDPHISRNYPIGKIRGRSFRLSIETRMLTPSPQTNAYIMASGGARFVFPLANTWMLSEGEWTAKGDTDVLRVLLRELDGLAFEVRNLRLFERIDGNWVDLGEGLGPGLRLRADNPEFKLITFQDYDPKDVWQTYTLSIPGQELDPSSPLSTQLFLGEGLVMQVRNSQLNSASSQASLVLRNVRQRLWFPDANLAGHSIAALGLVFLSMVSSISLAMWGFLCLLIATFLTGSKTAFLVALLFGSVFIFMLFQKKSTMRPFLLIMLFLSLSAGLFVSYGISFPDINNLQSYQAFSRPAIWQVAWNAFLDHPLTGLPNQDFLSYFQMHHPEAPIVAHAHNFWLDFAAKYGILGLVSSLILTFYISLFAWQQARWHGLLFVTAFWALQVFDYTLLFSGVLFLLILGLNFFHQAPTANRADDARAPT